MRPDFEPSPVVTIVLLGAIVCLGAWLRLEDLGGESLWLDESASWIQSRGSFAELIAMTANDNYPPLHNILLFASMKVFGSDSEWVLRLPSALLGILNLVVIYWLGSMLGGRLAGLLAALILALSGFHIYYSQEARMYALLAFAATLYAASAFYFARSPDWWRAAFVALSGLILLYAHPFGALNWIALFGAVGFLILPTVSDARRAIWLWLVANGIAALGFVPWAIVLLRRVALVAGNFHPPWPTIDVVYAQLYPLLGGRWVGAALLLGAVLAFTRTPRAAAVLAAWALLPVVVAYLVSVVSTPMFLGRYLIASVPAIATLSALGFVVLAGRRWAWALAAAVVLIVVASLRYVSAPRDDWRGAAAHLRERMDEGDCVLIYPRHASAPLGYYARHDYCLVRPPLVTTDGKPGQSSIAAIDPAEIAGLRAFVVLSRLDRSEIAAVRQRMRAYGEEVGHFDTHRIAILEYRKNVERGAP